MNTSFNGTLNLSLDMVKDNLRRVSEGKQILLDEWKFVKNDLTKKISESWADAESEKLVNRIKSLDEKYSKCMDILNLLEANYKKIIDNYNDVSGNIKSSIVNL